MLWQFAPEDHTHVIVDMNKTGKIDDPTRPGVAVTLLFEDECETVQLEYWQPGTQVQQTFAEGAEILVLAGDFTDSGDRMEAMSWMRLPRGGQIHGIAGERGTQVWMKQRHLRFVVPELLHASG